jgi:hypothetical protein
MSALWPVFAIILFVWVLTRGQRRRNLRRYEPDPRDDEIARLKDRVRVLEKLVTDDDRRLAHEINRLRREEAGPRAGA